MEDIAQSEEAQMNIGWTELLLILGLGLLLFGPSRLPNLGKSLGEAIRGFKKAVDGSDDQNSRNVSQQSQIQHDGQNSTTEKSKQEEKETNKNS